ncbi:MAG: hypothetical protein JST22_12595 [Bacteroidetes bacterium]|nr:hypothetical protein [Bacteroidota bacterium]
MKTHGVIRMVFGAVLMLAACKETATGPNDLGGDTNLDLTQVGNTFTTFLNTDSYVPGFDHMQDSVVITRNDNGIVTTHAQVRFDSVFVAALDSSLGIASYPKSVKLAILDTYLKRYGAAIDSTNKQAMKVTFDLKMKVTSDGLQEFISSKGDLSRPYTIVKYAASVGDKYEFTNTEGIKITREVTYKSTTDDYQIGFMLIKVEKVEETSDDPLVEKITYYANHKFGLVGVVLRTKTGKELKLGIIPPTM